MNGSSRRQVPPQRIAYFKVVFLEFCTHFRCETENTYQGFGIPAPDNAVNAKRTDIETRASDHFFFGGSA
jgi:hypothetical protein